MPDPDTTHSDRLRTHNIEATFANRDLASQALDRLKEEGLQADVTLDLTEDKRSVLRAEMRDEVEATVAGPGNVGPFTKAMMKGIVVWVAGATVAGAAIMALLSLFLWRDGVTQMATIGATAGATVGFVIGGFVWPRRTREGQDLAAETGSIVGIHSDDPAVIERAEALLRDIGEPVRLDRVDATGRPYTPGSEDAKRPLRGDVPTGTA